MKARAGEHPPPGPSWSPRGKADGRKQQQTNPSRFPINRCAHLLLGLLLISAHLVSLVSAVPAVAATTQPIAQPPSPDTARPAESPTATATLTTLPAPTSGRTLPARSYITITPASAITTTSTSTTSTTTTTTEQPASSVAAAAAEEEVDPQRVDLCIMEASSAYKLNQSWLEEPCNQSCRCVFRSEPRDPTADVRLLPTANLKPGSDQTEIRCGLPAHCQSVAARLAPTADCPAPKLVMAQKSSDVCACPRVTCSPKPTAATPPITVTAPVTVTTVASTAAAAATVTTRAPILPTTTTTTSTTLAPLSTAEVGEIAGELPELAGCRAKSGRMLSVGELFNDECHSTCRCNEDSEIRCQPLLCPAEPLAGEANCARWTLELPGAGNLSSGVDDSTTRCCPQYVCREPVVRLRSCHMMGKEVAHGERLPEEIQPRTPECEKACFCNDGKIICQPVCPSLGDFPPDDFSCPPGQAYRASDECCAKWSCPITEEYALQAFEVSPMNATSVEVSFLLPLFAVGHRGQAELNFTGVPASVGESGSGSASDMPPVEAVWTRKANIRTTDGIFLNQAVKYHLNNLKPNHKYWFKLVVRFQNASSPLDDPLESSLQRVVMPQLAPRALPETTTPTMTMTTTQVTTPSTTTSTTTTVAATMLPPTTTTPQTRLLQPRPKQSHTTTTTTTTTVAPTTTSSAPPTTTSTTTTTTIAPTSKTTTTTEQPPSSSSTTNGDRSPSQDVARESETTNSNNINNMKPAVGEYQPTQPQSPCGKAAYDNNAIDDGGSGRLSLPWTDQIQSQMNGPIQRYAWHLLVGFFIMTILFTIVSFMYCKKSSCAIAPITPPSVYDNPSFTKLKSYNPQTLLIDETSHQNYSNDAILAQQKNLEVDKSSPFHHQLNDLHHHNGRQHLI